MVEQGSLSVADSDESRPSEPKRPSARKGVRRPASAKKKAKRSGDAGGSKKTSVRRRTTDGSSAAKGSSDKAARGKTGSLPAVGSKSSRESGAVKRPAGAGKTRSTGVQRAVSGAAKKGSGKSPSKTTSVGGKSTTGTLKAAPSAKGKASKSERSASSGSHGKARLKKRGLGLAGKFSIPVGVIILLAIVLWGILVGRTMKQMMMNDVKKNGITAMNVMARLGEQVLVARASHPGAWPIALGLVQKGEIARAFGENKVEQKILELGFQSVSRAYRLLERESGGTKSQVKALVEALGAKDPRDALTIIDERVPKYPAPSYVDDGRDAEGDEGGIGAERQEFLRGLAEAPLEEFDRRFAREVSKQVMDSGVLRDLILVSVAGSEPQPNDVLDAYIADPNGYLVLGTRGSKGDIKIETVRTDNRVNFRGTDLEVDDIEIEHVIVTSQGRQHKALSFSKEIRVKVTGNLVRGTVFFLLSAEMIDREASRLRNLMIGIGVAAIVCAAGICFLVAWIVTTPVHTLIHDMDIVAQGDLEHKTRAHSSDEIGAIAEQFNEMTQRLCAAQAAEREAQRLEDELEMAREIQLKLLPPKLPHLKGLDIDARYHPAKEVGGDYYDLFPIDKEHLGVIVADVSGKGIPGSMVMATTRTVLRFTAAGNRSAADTLGRTNRVVAADIRRGMFVTAFYLVLNARTHEMVAASAGHNPMVVYRAATKEVDLVNPSGIALGFDKGPLFERTIKETSVPLAPGDRAVLYTDGVVEAMDEENEEYTTERFVEFVKSNTALSSKEFVDALLVDLKEHQGSAEQHDDITVVTFQAG